MARRLAALGKQRRFGAATLQRRSCAGLPPPFGRQLPVAGEWWSGLRAGCLRQAAALQDCHSTALSNGMQRLATTARKSGFELGGNAGPPFRGQPNVAGEMAEWPEAAVCGKERRLRTATAQCFPIGNQ